MSQPLKRSLHNGLNKVSGSESRLCPLPCPPRGWPRLRSSPPRRRWRATRPLCRRRRTPTRGRGRPGDRTPRPKIVAPLALPGPALPPTNVWGVGGCIDPACLLAQVNTTAPREGESPSSCRAGPGVHRDASPLSVLARAHPVRGVYLSPGAHSPWFISAPKFCEGILEQPSKNLDSPPQGMCSARACTGLRLSLPSDVTHLILHFLCCYRGENPQETPGNFPGWAADATMMPSWGWLAAKYVCASASKSTRL